MRWEIDWTPESEAHIAHHGVEASEVDEVLDRETTEHPTRLGRRAVFGQSAAGRYLVVIVEPLGRVHEGRAVAKLVTARRMTDSERRLYRRRKP